MWHEIVLHSHTKTNEVTMGIRQADLKHLKNGTCPFKDRPKGKEVIWCVPEMVCIVENMPNAKDALRQPEYKGIRTE